MKNIKMRLEFAKVYLIFLNRIDDLKIILEDASRTGQKVFVEELKNKLPKYFGQFKYVLESKTIPFISYPYEWSFDQLKDAALLLF